MVEMFLFLPFFFIPFPVPTDLLRDLDSLSGDNVSLWGEVEDILCECFDDFECFLCGDTDSLWNELLCIAEFL